jgi:hypothetical protein
VNKDDDGKGQRPATDAFTSPFAPEPGYRHRRICPAFPLAVGNQRPSSRAANGA